MENQIEIGETVTYPCPWTGFDTVGEVIGENATWGEGFYDIRRDDDGDTDTAIHFTDCQRS